MKKKLFVALTFAAFLSLVFIACKKEEDGVQVGYASESSTGNNPDNTSAGTTSTTFGSTTSTSGATTSSTSGSTTSTTSSTSGSTTSNPTNNYFKVTSGSTPVVYNCSTVTSATSGSLWKAMGRTAAGDSCTVTFSAMPGAGSYSQSSSPIPSSIECYVTVKAGGVSYHGIIGSAAVTIPSGTQRKISISAMTLVNTPPTASFNLDAVLTTP
jgi:hypothetical protein